MNVNWSRWIRASVDKHFDTLVKTSTFPMFIEGQKRNTRTIKDFFECRMDGPRIINLSHNYYVLTIKVNILIQSAMDDSSYHRIETDISQCLKGFTNRIVVYKYGKATGDDKSILGCLNLQHSQRGRERLIVSRMGQIDPQTEIVQAIIEGQYRIELTT